MRSTQMNTTGTNKTENTTESSNKYTCVFNLRVHEYQEKKPRHQENEKEHMWLQTRIGQDVQEVLKPLNGRCDNAIRHQDSTLDVRQQSVAVNCANTPHEHGHTTRTIWVFLSAYQSDILPGKVYESYKFPHPCEPVRANQHEQWMFYNTTGTKGRRITSQCTHCRMWNWGWTRHCPAELINPRWNLISEHTSFDRSMTERRTHKIHSYTDRYIDR
jgi:hypothetical protein